MVPTAKEILISGTKLITIAGQIIQDLNVINQDVQKNIVRLIMDIFYGTASSSPLLLLAF